MTIGSTCLRAGPHLYWGRGTAGGYFCSALLKEALVSLGSATASPGKHSGCLVEGPCLSLLHRTQQVADFVYCLRLPDFPLQCSQGAENSTHHPHASPPMPAQGGWLVFTLPFFNARSLEPLYFWLISDTLCLRGFHSILEMSFADGKLTVGCSALT